MACSVWRLVSNCTSYINRGPDGTQHLAFTISPVLGLSFNSRDFQSRRYCGVIDGVLVPSRFSLLLTRVSISLAEPTCARRLEPSRRDESWLPAALPTPRRTARILSNSHGADTTGRRRRGRHRETRFTRPETDATHAQRRYREWQRRRQAPAKAARPRQDRGRERTPWVPPAALSAQRLSVRQQGFGRCQPALACGARQHRVSLQAVGHARTSRHHLHPLLYRHGSLRQHDRLCRPGTGAEGPARFRRADGDDVRDIPLTSSSRGLPRGIAEQLELTRPKSTPVA